LVSSITPLIGVQLARLGYLKLSDAPNPVNIFYKTPII